MEQLTTLINENTAMAILALPFVSMFLFKIGAIFKSVSSKITGLFSYGINADNNDRFHQYLYAWLSEQKYIRVKTFKIEMPWGPNINTLESGDLEYNPIAGTYYCKPKGLPLFSVHSRIETNGNALHKIADVKIFTFSRKKVRKLVDNILEHAKDKSTGKIFKPSGSSYWDEAASLDTEFFNNQFISDSSAKVFKEIETFLGGKETYFQKNLKYRKGMLLHGIPGSGKSTLAGQIAAKYGMNVYIMSGSSFYNAGTLLAAVPNKSLIVFEDFDLANLTKRELQSKEGEDDNGIKPQNTQDGFLSTNATAELLNALDGLISMNGSVLIATTNKVEELDEALIRPGRFDSKIEMNGLGKSEQERYIAKFYGEDKVTLPEDTKSLPIADLASKCTDNMNDYDKLIETLTEE